MAVHLDVERVTVVPPHEPLLPCLPTHGKHGKNNQHLATTKQLPGWNAVSNTDILQQENGR